MWEGRVSGVHTRCQAWQGSDPAVREALLISLYVDTCFSKTYLSLESCLRDKLMFFFFF